MSYAGYQSYLQGSGQQPSQPGPPKYQSAPPAYALYPGSAAPQPQHYQYGSSQYPVPSAPYPEETSYPNSASTAPYQNLATTTPYPTSTPCQPVANQPFPVQLGIYPAAAAPYAGMPVGLSSSYPSNTFTSFPYSQQSPYNQQQSSGYPATAHPGPQAQPSHFGAHAGFPSGAQGITASLYSNPAQIPQSSTKPLTPTVRAANPFNPRQDAEILRKAMKGFGTDEKALINILTNRTNAQRQQIAIDFKTMYEKDLIANIKSEVGGNLEHLLVALMTPIPEFLAKELHHAVSGLGSNEKAIVEILCTATNYDIKCINEAYERLYRTSLERDLAGETSGNFRRLLVSLCQGNRSEVYAVDQAAAVEDAQTLLRAGEPHLGTEESTFNAILSSRSYTQLAQIFVEYFRLSGYDFERAIRNKFSGSIESGLLAIVKSVRNKCDFFAEQIQNSTASTATKDRVFIRIIVSRSEIDLGDIKVAYQNKYGRSLEDAISSETSGDYKRALLSLAVCLTPTVRPANPFNPRQDVEILRKAMKTFATVEKGLINVLTHRTNAQRQQIAIDFKKIYGNDLISKIKSVASGNFEDLLVALMTPIPEFLAKELHHAVSVLGTNEKTIVEILCTARNYDIKCINAAYERLYRTSLERDLAWDTPGNFRRLLVSFCQGNRCEVDAVDQAAAVQDAQKLLRAGELQLGTDESTFNAILSSRSYTQLAQIFMEYFRLTGNDIEEAIRNEFSGSIESGLLAVVKSVRNKCDFFAEQIQNSTTSAATKDRVFIRIIVSRSEIDLGDIKVAYQRKYGRSLEDAISSETSDDYKRALLSLAA